MKKIDADELVEEAFLIKKDKDEVLFFVLALIFVNLLMFLCLITN